MAIDLYYIDDSPPCRAVMMVANMIGVKLNKKLLDWTAGDLTKPEFLKINPQHNVPTIDDDGFYLNESRAINAYLVNKYAKDDTLYPKIPKIRALVDQRLYFDIGVFYLRFTQTYFPVALDGATQLDKKAQDNFAIAVNFLENFLTKHKYAAGNHLTIADISLISSATSMEAVDKTVFSNHPHIQGWIKNCKAEIPDYHEINDKAAEAYGQWIQSALAKINQS